MSLKVTFPGGVAVNAEYKGQIIRTDQPREYGGGGTAPAPFDLFLASIGAILRAVDQCAVKRHIAEPPRFEIHMTVPEEMNLEAAGVPDR